MKKVALIAIVVVLIVLVARLWPHRTDAVAPAPSPSPTSALPVPTTTPPAAPTGTSATPESSSGPYGGSAEARRVWEPIVQGFALAFPDTDGLTRKQWLANLRPFLDPRVVDALASTDMEKVQHGHYAGYQLLKVADEAITVRVTYQEGWALDLYLAATGNHHWSVASFDLATAFD